MKTKLKFTPSTDRPNEYIAEPYKVTRYDWTSNGRTIIEKPCWRAYYRIYDSYSKKMLFGNAVEKVSEYEGMTYSTKLQAIAACQKHVDSQGVK